MRSDWLLPAILGVFVSVRVATSLALGDQVQSLPRAADQVSYHALAQQVLAGEGFTFDTAWWPAIVAG